MLAVDGLGLHAVRVVPETPPRAAVLLVHGLGEHSGRYRHVITELAAAGLAVLAVDLRGFGRSDGQRGHAEDLGALLRDLDALVALHQLDPALAPLPRFLLGHSLGGLLAIHYLLARPTAFAGVILSSPALALHTPPHPLKVLAARILSPLLPTLPLHNEVDAVKISGDPGVVADYLADPLCHDRISCRLGQVSLDAQAAALARAPEFTAPLLVLIGTADRLVSPEASRRFVAAAGSPIKELREYEGFAHEVLNEPEGRRPLGDLLAWIARRLDQG